MCSRFCDKNRLDLRNIWLSCQQNYLCQKKPWWDAKLLARLCAMFHSIYLLFTDSTLFESILQQSSQFNRSHQINHIHWACAVTSSAKHASCQSWFSLYLTLSGSLCFCLPTLLTALLLLLSSYAQTPPSSCKEKGITSPNPGVCWVDFYYNWVDSYYNWVECNIQVLLYITIQSILEMHTTHFGIHNFETNGLS